MMLLAAEAAAHDYFLVIRESPEGANSGKSYDNAK